MSTRDPQLFAEIFPILADRLPPIANVVVSNVALSPVPLYIAGAQITSYWPVLILMHGMGLGLATHSYAGSMEGGVVACRRSMPEVDDFASDLMASFAELLAAALAGDTPQLRIAKPGADAVPRKARARKTPAVKAERAKPPAARDTAARRAAATRAAVPTRARKPKSKRTGA